MDIREAGLKAVSIHDMVMEKTANPVEAMLVLKMTMAMFEAYMRYQGINLKAKEFDAAVSKFVKDFEKTLHQ